MVITPVRSNESNSNWVANAVRTERVASTKDKAQMLTASEVATRLGYRSRPSFWAWVHREQPPHVRISSRKIRFPKKALDAWLAKRSNTGEVE